MITVLLGLLGLSIVVIVHEFGHFVIARSVGVDVEAFSIGWGPPLFKHKGKRTEWRIGVLPIGGYCKLKGEDGFRAALEQNWNLPIDSFEDILHIDSLARTIAANNAERIT